MLSIPSIEILLVEDELAHAELIQRAFEDQAPAVHIERVSLLSKARGYLSNTKPDLIITDWHLPDGNGLELLSGQENSLDVPVIFMTSYGSERIAVEAISSGALDYVVKSPESLMDMPHIAERAIQQGAAKIERARMQEALARSESEFRLLAENASDMISRHDILACFDTLPPPPARSLDLNLKINRPGSVGIHPPRRHTENYGNGKGTTQKRFRHTSSRIEPDKRMGNMYGWKLLPAPSWMKKQIP